MYRFNRADNERAQHFFETAVRLDPTFARAHAGLSFTHWQGAFQGWSERQPAIERAYEEAGRSLMADERDPAAHWAMGRALWLRGTHDQALTELERAIDHFVADLPALRAFILPGGSPAGASLHAARCVCRRAEREIMTLARTATVRPAPDRGLPAIVAAAAADEPGIATLVLTPLEEGIAARLERGSGAALIDERTVLRTAGLGEPASTGGAGLGGPTADQLAPDLAASDLADLAVTLAVPSGADAAPLLESADVRFVLLAERSRTTGSEAPAAVRAAITASLDADPLLVPVGDTDAGLLWRVVADDETPAAIAARPATAWPFLAAQLGILALTLLLAVPTGRRPRRVRAEHGTIDDPATTFAEDDDD